MKLHVTQLGVFLAILTTSVPTEAKVLKHLNPSPSYPKGVETLVSPRVKPVKIEKTEAQQLLEKGLEQYQTGQIEQAITSLQAALTQFRQLNDRRGEAATLGLLGSIYHQRNDYTKALEFYQQSLPLARLVNPTLEGILLRAMGGAYHLLGQTQEAIRFYEKALVWLQQEGLSDPENAKIAASVRLNLGIADHQEKNFEKAAQNLEKSLQQFEQFGDRANQGIALSYWGRALLGLGQDNDAIKRLEQSVPLLQAANNTLIEADSWLAIGATHLIQKNSQDSLKAYQQASQLYRQRNNTLGEAMAMDGMGLAYSQLEQYSKAIQSYQQALTLFEQIGDRFRQGIVFYRMGLVYGQSRQPQNALTAYQQALSIFQELGENQAVSAVRREIEREKDNQEITRQ